MLGSTIDPLTAPSATAGKPYALVALLQLHWFTRLRWLFAAAALAVLAIERFVLPDAHRPARLLLAVMSVAGVNLVWTYVSRVFRRQFADPRVDQKSTIRAGQLFGGAQIGVDLLLLTWILSLTGGVENPMSLFYLFHVAISGLLLRTWQALVQSCWAVVLYVVMCVGQAQGWITYYPFLPHLGAAGLHAVPHHVIMVVIVLALAVFGTLYFTDRIGKVLDKREDMLIRANAALEKSRQAIHDLQVRRSRFMQTAAHQLKSPLAMVQTLTNLIRDGIVTDEADIRATCDKIVRRSREGIAQVTELLALARVQEADPQRHRESHTDVAEVVTELCGKHAAVAEAKSIDLSWHIPEEGDLAVCVNQADLVDCVGNLIENAIKYTPDGGSVTVTVLNGARLPSLKDLPAALAAGGRLAPEDYVHVIVKDTGIGLGGATQLLEDGTPADGSIFEAFRRGSAAVAAGIPGTGLGLSIVREVVEQVGGFIHVRSRPGQGSAFTVSFPVRPSEPGATARDTRSSDIVVEEHPAAAAQPGAASGSDPASPVDRSGEPGQ